MKKVLCAIALISMVACSPTSSESTFDPTEETWESLEQKASGTTVNFMMWQGNPPLNDYINNFLVPTLKERYGMTMSITGGQGPEIVQLVMGEKQAGIENGQVDIVWINGETFFQLRKIDGLWGPFVKKLPNAQYIDFDNPFINTDFQQPVNYMEAPWGMGQFAMVYDSAKVPNPPRNLQQLEEYVKNNPGTFTISNDFSGMTLLKSFLAEFGGSPTSLDGDFDEEKYERLSTQLWEYLNRNKKYFWKEGSTFPKEHTKMDQMFATGELHLAYGFSEGGIEDKVKEGLFPTTARAYAWDNGTIMNSNYLGIPYNSANKAGAMVAINFMLSPEAQYQKVTISGRDRRPIIEIDRLPEEWQQKFNNLPPRQYAPDPEKLAQHAIQEPAPQYMIRLYEDFRSEVIEK